ncbi:hypothetical protein D9V41_09495 [Aeromicrobium phragmitis]|uniref:YCII-related domain-containing protein n=1 Tax=Aeromicrobium phragmitis TaxID=2478914 RepID=A0A3L8PKC5_9ACTN|nr:YciI family protein [Aeromicrobium phragmitis]RLV55690.1 hypothetical protein D9V41_09495 [Aeromicrobium phragmitis]
MPTPTHVLLHRYTPGSGPAEGTAEHDAEMRQWAQVDEDLLTKGALVAGFALDGPGKQLGATQTPGDDMVFAVHVIAAASDAEAEQIASRMPHVGYGSVEVRPLMAR